MYGFRMLGRESDSLISTRRLYAEDAGEAVRLCEALLDEPELDPAVRIGDAYGFVVEHHCQQGNFQVVHSFFYVCENGKSHSRGIESRRKFVIWFCFVSS